MREILLQNRRITESGDELQIRMTSACHASTVLWLTFFELFLVFSASVSLLPIASWSWAWSARVFGDGEEPPFRCPVIVCGIFLCVSCGAVYCAVWVGRMLGLVLRRGRVPIILDRRSGRVMEGRDEVARLDEVAVVRVLKRREEDAEGVVFDVHTIALGLRKEGNPGPFPVACFYYHTDDEVGEFAGRVAAFAGVPVQEPRKSKAPAALADDALAGDFPGVGD